MQINLSSLNTASQNEDHRMAIARFLSDLDLSKEDHETIRKMKIAQHPKTNFDEDQFLKRLANSAMLYKKEKLLILKKIPDFCQKNIDILNMILKEEALEFLDFTPEYLDAQIGYKLYKTDKFALALDWNERIRKEYENKRKTWSVAQVDKNICLMLRCLGRYKKALERYEKIRKVYKDEGAILEVAKIETSIGATLNHLCRYEEALESYEKSRKVHDDQGLVLNVVRIDNLIGMTLIRLNRYKEVLELYKKIRKVYEDRGSAMDVAQINLIIGMALGHLGRYREALGEYEKIRKIYENKGLTCKVAQVDENICLVLKRLGRYKEALEGYEKSRKVYENKKLAHDVATIYDYIGVITTEFVPPKEALEQYKKFRNIYKNEGYELGIAQINQYIGQALSQLWRPKEAIELYEKSRKIYEAKGSAINVAHIDMDIGTMQRRLGRYKEALELYEKSRKVYENEGDALTVAIIDRDIGVVQNELGRPKEALELYEKSRIVYEDKGSSENVAIIDIDIGSVQQSLGHYNDAMKKYISSLNYFQTTDLLLESIVCLANIAEVHEKFFRKDQAYNYREEAITACRKLRNMQSVQAGYIDSDSIKNDILAITLPVYKEMIQLCLDMGRFDKALEYIEETKAQNLAEKMASKTRLPVNAPPDLVEKFTDVRNRLQSFSVRIGKASDDKERLRLVKTQNKAKQELDKIMESIQSHDPDFDPFFRKRINCEEIQALVPDDNTAIVQIFPMDGQTLVFVIRQNQAPADGLIKVTELSEPALKDLAGPFINAYEDYMAAMKNRGCDQEKANHFQRWANALDKLLADLHGMLFMSIQPKLKGIDHLIFVPHGILHRIPLQAMFKMENNERRYLIDGYQVSFAPSAAILKACLEKKIPADNTATGVIVGTVQDSGLRYSKVEADAVDQMYSDCTYESNLTCEDIYSLIGSARIFHYSSHAERDGLILSDGRLSLVDIMAEYHLPFMELVVLSACESGIVRDSRVDDPVSLSTAFMTAGAAATVTSLWCVRDAATSLIMRKMHELYKEGQPVAKALQIAQLWLKDPEKKHEHTAMMNLIEPIHENQRFTLDDIDDHPAIECPDFSAPYFWAGFIASGRF